MRLALQRIRALGVKAHHAGVAVERTHDEVATESTRALAQLTKHRGRALDAVHHYFRAERLVRAVLAPRLGNRLDFDIGRSRPFDTK